MSVRSEFLATLTVLLQGPLTQKTAPEVVAQCRHWRAMLPGVPVILSISRDPDSVAAIERRIMIYGLRALCTQVIVAPPARRLPPVKRGLGNNHVNLQIAAARAGLAAVDTARVLRIRHDMAFDDASFVDFYLRHRDYPRGPDALLGDRVMIAPWFTLDPLTLERLPFHFSDWFHLGRTTDVRALWQIPAMTKADSTWYRRHPYAPGTGAREAVFLARYASEQHIVAAAYAGLGRRLPLTYHNDPDATNRSLRLLADDFLVADFAATPVRFAKYDHLYDAPDLDLACTTHAVWRALVDNPDLDPRHLFKARIAAAEALRSTVRRRPPWWRRLTGR